MYDYIIGIDPGVNGGIATIKGTELRLVKRCPHVKIKTKTDYDVQGMADIIKPYSGLNACIHLELVHSFPGQGVTSMFNFGKGYGMWLMAAAAYGMPIFLVTPQQWKKKILVNTDKSKGAAILKAKQVFPEVNLKPGLLRKEHDGMAEAICIALYGEIHNG